MNTKTGARTELQTISGLDYLRACCVDNVLKKR